MSEPTDWRDVLLNDDGVDLIYEVPGDAQRGNPLDIVNVATCNNVETVLGLRFRAKQVAKEVAKRWNSHADLLAACKAIIAGWGHQDGISKAVTLAREAIRKATQQ